MMLKEVLGFTSEEAAGILSVSEPVFRHRLSAARAKMTGDYDGLCALINKSGLCYQCEGLREFSERSASRCGFSADRSGAGHSDECRNLFDARLAIVRDADLEFGQTRTMHDMFYSSLTQREETRYDRAPRKTKARTGREECVARRRAACRERQIAGAAAESFFGGDTRDVGIIVLLGKMREDHMARAAIEYFGIGEKFTDQRVRKMAGAAHHALLDVPGIRPDLQHFEIVIRFENQEIGFAQMMLHQLGHVAEIGDDRDFHSIRAKSVADGIGGIMRNRERIDFDIADSKGFRGECMRRVRFWFSGRRDTFSNFAMRRLGEIGGAIPIARTFAQGRSNGRVCSWVIRMPSTRSGRARPSASKRRSISFRPMPASIRRVVRGRLEQRGVARAARSQNGNAKRDTLPSRALQQLHARDTAMDDGKVPRARQYESRKQN